MILVEFIFVILFGLIIGSFLNVVIFRLPLGEDLVFKRSHCPSCLATIPWYRNIPLISFLLQRGKCHSCRVNISWRYPIVESVNALLYGYFYIMLSSYRYTSEYYYELVFFFIVSSIFIIHFCIDLKHQILPDGLTLILAILFGAVGFYQIGWKQSLIGGLLGYAMTYAITWLFLVIRGVQGLGGGDIKLFGALGLIFGPLGILHNIIFSCLLGSIVGILLLLFRIIKRETPFPFGPMILVVSLGQITLHRFGPFKF